jgi:ribosomal protein S18 acetylase RimI-like enzyme
MDNDVCVGTIVCKLDRYRDAMRGYIAMLAVDSNYRGKQIGMDKIFFNSLFFKQARN